jgi:hypothetical protein
MAKRILNVVTNVGHYENPDHPTGHWLFELIHAWHVFEEAGFEQALVSPAGGGVPLEPRALKFSEFVDRYHGRSHEGLDGASPLERWFGDPTPLEVVLPDRLRHLLLARVERTVTKTGRPPGRADLQLRRTVRVCRGDRGGALPSRPSPTRAAPALDLDPGSGRARLSYRRAAALFLQHAGWTLAPAAPFSAHPCRRGRHQPSAASCPFASRFRPLPRALRSARARGRRPCRRRG